MDMTSVVRGRRARVTVTASRLELRLRSRPLAPALIALPETQRGTAFDGDLVAQLPVLRRYAHKLTRDREEAMDLVQDTCERALRFRHLFREKTSLRAWVLTIMRHHFLDTLKRKDAMVSGHRVPLEESSEWGAVAMCVGICWRGLQWDEDTRSGSQVNRLFSKILV